MLIDLKAENKLTIVPLVENATMLSILWQAGACFIQGHYVQTPSPHMNYDFSTE
jgi:EAL domain-containing protein (putative c-di-GMP-specific phosphodiesterase class I)